MELHAVIASIREGDTQAFDRLAAQYRDMAFGYALALVRQEQVAEDAVQDALVTAYTHLDRLQEPEAFGAWLRGIVRHQCLRTLRQHRTVSLDEDCEEHSLPGKDPLIWVVENAVHAQVWQAIERLPRSLREVVLLRYETELSQKEIAVRLNMTVSTVNMRLHSARSRLRRRLQTMMNNAASPHTTGSVVESNGPLALLQFAPNAAPQIFSRLTTDYNDEMLVVQHLNAGRVRAVAERDGAILTPGQHVQDTGQPFTRPLNPRIVQRVVDTLPAAAPGAARIPSGMKSIELFAPLLQAGRTGLFAEWGVGALVLVPELLRNLNEHRSRQTFYVFTPPPADVQQWQEQTREITSGTADVAILYLPIADPIAPASVNSVQALDCTLVLSRRMTEQAIYPSLDPLRCRSRQVFGGVQSAQAQVTENVRTLLREYYRLQFSVEERDWHTLTADQQQQLHRARRALRFLSQPFFVAEPYTGRPGAFVTSEQTFQGFANILSGRFDSMKPESLYMIGAAPAD